LLIEQEQLQVMTITDDGPENLHAQASPDGRVAFDSERDGERGIGSHLARIA
jgi:hypothetical protein